jgi:hypothetical protein
MTDLKVHFAEVFEEINEDMNNLGTEKPSSLLDGLVAVCVPKEYQKRYESIQRRSNRDFCKVLRKAVMMMIDQADEKI